VGRLAVGGFGVAPRPLLDSPLEPADGRTDGTLLSQSIMSNSMITATAYRSSIDSQLIVSAALNGIASAPRFVGLNMQHYASHFTAGCQFWYYNLSRMSNTVPGHDRIAYYSKGL
jgi:hypothetical protein